MKDLWDLAVGELKTATDSKKLGNEHVLILCGSKGVGKTTLINSFFQKDETIKPTTALEYSFGYVHRGSEKDIGHVYELGGGTWLAKLLGSVINPVVVSNTSVAIMVDLTSPATIWRVLEHLIHSGRAACDNAIDAVDKHQSAKIREAANTRYSEDHPDRQIPGLLRTFPVPLIIIGGKYDLFQAMEPEPRKQVCRGLRFFANTFGATLLFYSHRQEQLLTRMNNFLSNVVFGSEFTRRSPIVDNNKPLFIPVGADNFQDIGAPPASEVRSRASDPVNLWMDSLTGMFPLKDEEKEAFEGSGGKNAPNPVADPQFAEAIIDSLRKQKDVELERYRRASERRARDLVSTGSQMQDIYD